VIKSVSAAVLVIRNIALPPRSSYIHYKHTPRRGIARNLLRGTNQGVWGRKSPAGSRGRIWKL